MTLATLTSSAIDLVRVETRAHRFEKSFRERVLVICGIPIRRSDLDEPKVVAAKIRAAMAEMADSEKTFVWPFGEQ